MPGKPFYLGHLFHFYFFVIMSLPTWASVVIGLGAATLLAMLGDYVYSSFTRVPFKPAGKHCFITGGSTGLGKSLAIELAKAGADICIVARRVTELEAAVKEIKVLFKRTYVCVYNTKPTKDTYSS